LITQAQLILMSSGTSLPSSASDSMININHSSLWGFLTSWRHLFDRFDVDRSGTISLDEFTSALTAFGYRLSPQYVRQLFDAYDLKGRGVLSFDLFVQSCISLKRMTDVFRKYDDDRDGYITLSL
jgi:Ca2+-binding EF-hand superfamily protein